MAIASSPSRTRTRSRQDAPDAPPPGLLRCFRRVCSGGWRRRRLTTFTRLKGIASLSPGKRIHMMLDMFTQRDSGAYPDIYGVHVSLRAPALKKRLSDDAVLDLGVYRNVLTRLVRTSTTCTRGLRNWSLRRRSCARRCRHRNSWPNRCASRAPVAPVFQRSTAVLSGESASGPKTPKPA
jgi:hypothetical protein